MAAVRQIPDSAGLARDKAELGETVEDVRDRLVGKLEIREDQPTPYPVPFKFPPDPPDPVFAAEVAEAREEIRKSLEQVKEFAKNKTVIEELQKAGVEIDLDAVDRAVPSSKNVEAVLLEQQNRPHHCFDEDLEELRAKVPLGPEVHLPMGLEQLRDAVVGLTRDPDLRVFKKQVLEAFKFLGVDTKRFFGV